MRRSSVDLGPSPLFCWSCETTRASAMSLVTRLGRQRTLAFVLSLVIPSVIVGYALLSTGNGESSCQTISDNNNNQLDATTHQTPSTVLAVNQDSRESVTPDKIVLLWTPYDNQSFFHMEFGRQRFETCQLTNCILTTDRRLLDQSDAVLFHALQFDGRDLPAHRHPRQPFIFFLYETVPNTSIPCAGRCLPEFAPHYFNWTMTHRRDSDIYLADAYGGMAPNYRTLPIQLPDDLPPDTLPANPADVLNRNYPQLAKRTKMIAWFVSHCSTHGQREDYVKILANFVQVDIYGKCGTMECLPRNSQRCGDLLENYKFYLAAENSLCPDYVTEKFYRALMNDVVPIVYGGADYTDYAPPHSFINVADFRTPKDLADYLKLLDSNDALYMEYLQWKKHYHVLGGPKKGWCDLCAKLNDPHLLETESKSYEDVNEWWVHKLPCYPGSSFLANHT